MVSEKFNLATLRAIPIFEPLQDPDLEALRPALRVHKIPAGEVVVHEGDAADKLYILVDGEVQVVKNYLQPGAQTVEILKPGSYFGEMALVGEGEKRSATVITSEDSHFLSLDRTAFKKILLENPLITYTLLVETFRRLRQANELLAITRQELDEQT